jgi:lysophospholipase L1-like esterase
LSVIIVLGGLELILRTLLSKRMAAEADSPLQQSAVRGLGYELIPNHNAGKVRTGPLGLRLRSASGEAPRHQILLIGDSVAYGMGVAYEHSLAPILESELDRGSGGRTAVWNAAVPGYNTVQEALRLQQIGAILKPDVVVVQFCLNDHLGAARLAPDGILDAAPGDGNEGTFSPIGLAYRSRVLVLLKNKLRDLQQLYPEWFPVWAHYIRRVSGKPGWVRAKAALLEMQARARQQGAGLLVVVFPVEQQLRIGERTAQDDLLRFAASHGIEMLDLYPAFQAQWRQGLYVDYWGNSRAVDKLHPNERGHALAAREIARVLSASPRGSVHTGAGGRASEYK